MNFLLNFVMLALIFLPSSQTLFILSSNVLSSSMLLYLTKPYFCPLQSLFASITILSIPPSSLNSKKRSLVLQPSPKLVKKRVFLAPVLTPLPVLHISHLVEIALTLLHPLLLSIVYRPPPPFELKFAIFFTYQWS